VAVLKQIFFYISLLLTVSILSASIPLHSIVHEHYFVKADPCAGHSCAKHIKNYSEPCCKTSDAIFIASLPQVYFNFEVFPSASTLVSFYHFDNDFKFHFLVNNKAPPVAAV